VRNSLARNRPCVKNLWRYCDVNADRKLTHQEWINCLGLGDNSENSISFNGMLILVKNTVLLVSFRLFQSLRAEKGNEDNKQRGLRRSKGGKRPSDQGRGNIKNVQTETSLFFRFHKLLKLTNSTLHCVCVYRPQLRG